MVKEKIMPFVQARARLSEIVDVWLNMETPISSATVN